MSASVDAQAETAHRFEGPCAGCPFKPDCAVYPGLASHLFARPGFQVGDRLDQIDRTLQEACAAWLASAGAPLPSDRPLSVRLSAFFDLAMSLLYIRDLIEPMGSNWRFRKAGVTHDDVVVFPFTWMCPLCVAEGRPRSDCYLPESRQERLPRRPARDYPVVSRLAKPNSRAIGDHGFRVLMAIIRAASSERADIRISSGGGRRGEFDVTLATEDVLAFGEVKAKPLVCFPLLVAHEPSPNHEWLVPKLNNASLFIGASNSRIGLGRIDGPMWPLDQLGRLAADPNVVGAVESAWLRQLKAYRQWKREPDELRWLRFGCGNFAVSEDGLRVEKRVANTKELPGLDRTDDIKKGTTQVLLFSRLKFGCRKAALKAILFGNTFAETHEQDYLGPLASMQLTGPDGDRTEPIFDAIVGLTKNVVNDATVAGILGVLGSSCAGAPDTSIGALTDTLLAERSEESEDGDGVDPT